MKNSILIILILCCYQSSFAQTRGKGGGLYVRNFYDSSLKKIPIDDSSFSIKINGKTFNKEKIDEGKIYIPPSNNDSLDQELIHLQIAYKNKEYIIDIENIKPRKNSGGYSETMDSLVLDRPYILSRRSRDRSLWPFSHSLTSTYLKKGITPYTNEYLHTIGYTHFSPDYINDQKQLPWENYFQKAYEKYCLNCKNLKSLELLKQARKDNSNEYNAYIFNLELRILSYNALENIENAQTIIDLIDSHPDIPLDFRLEDVKAQSFILLKQYDKAIEETKKLEISYDPDEREKLHYRYEKNKVRFYKSNYKEIINDLSPLFKDKKREYFLNDNSYKQNGFEQLNKFYFLYTFCSFLQNPTIENKENLSASLHYSKSDYQDYDFITYLLKDFYMNAPITPEKFEGFKLLFNVCLKEYKL